MNFFSYVYQARVPYITYYRESLTTWAWQPYRRVSLPSTYKSQLLFQWTRPGSCQQSNLYKYEFWRAFHQKSYSANSFRMTTRTDPLDRSHLLFHGTLSCYILNRLFSHIFLVLPCVVTLHATQHTIFRLRDDIITHKACMYFTNPRPCEEQLVFSLSLFMTPP